MIRASGAGRSGATARVESSRSRRRSAARIASAASARRVEAALLGPAAGPLLDRGVEEELQVRVGQDDRPDVAAGHDDPAGAPPARAGAASSAARSSGTAETAETAASTGGRVDVGGPIDAVDEHAGQAAVAVGGQLDLAGRAPRAPAGSVAGDAAGERQPGDRPVEQPRVAEPVADAKRRRGADAALARRAGTVEGDDEARRVRARAFVRGAASGRG